MELSLPCLMRNQVQGEKKNTDSTTPRKQMLWSAGEEVASNAHEDGEADGVVHVDGPVIVAVVAAPQVLIDQTVVKAADPPAKKYGGITSFKNLYD
eukprot:CAMPEP_0170557412 /NCGR_PEP_ID=MMETSP0211-20121228/25421_1 /TAXON_ID=311385 /ORGANISM="Pseudokeronopsis sp., Strain OXSARD2" /LENGTH=95 /DNA_ID=CAMNT_0010868421 /DNA_START=113 /DNA_END=400 /DNA_ORIENTATION=-